MFNARIPDYVLGTLKTLSSAGFEAYLVGGCVRDLYLERIPKDWDVTTNAVPEQIQALFPHTVYENTFGTVGIVCDEVETVINEDGVEQPKPIVEITPYRTEMSYSDKRHPDGVSFSMNLEDDLKRRDFTINSLAYDPINNILKDIYKGQNDLKDKVLRTVGNPDDRFTEDALRILRAIRFSVELDFAVSHETLMSIHKNTHLINDISWERKRDEFVKMIMSPNPVVSIGLLEKTGLLEHLIPELREGIGCEQKGAHIYDVFEHMLHALGHACEKNQPLEIRLSALFHDIGKPRTRRYDKTKDKYTFYGHEVVGARMVAKIMDRFKFSRETSELVTKLVRYHMFFSDTEVITLSPVRRMIQNVGVDHIWELMQVRECDRVGMRKAEAPFRLRKYHAMIEEALRDPISVSQLKIDGTYLIKDMGMQPGRRMGWILLALLEDVLEDPTKNTIEALTERVKQLDKLPDAELKKLAEQAKEQKDELNEEEIKKLHVKHGVGKK
jgi:tRNA nucleotidyltransferase (CCA-adding enzyme)